MAQMTHKLKVLTQQHQAVLGELTTVYAEWWRARTHGDKVQNHQAIADLWNGYLGNRLATAIEPRDVALMMALLKIARTKYGAHNPDDYIDMAGYAGVAGEIAEREQPV